MIAAVGEMRVRKGERACQSGMNIMRSLSYGAQMTQADFDGMQ